ncbi:MAG: polysaccharide deacetylase family protein [Anaerolineae bacterium]|nr:polysaccharide deacetylase family protein [Anaerolineae bacterium]
MHRVLRRRFPDALWMGDTNFPVVALTFDDGPDPRDTEALLRVLDRHGAAATFFLIGERARRYPDLVRAVADAGHQQGLHGYYHRAFPLQPAPRLAHSLRQTQAALAEATGQPPDQYRDVRPPYGVFTPSTLKALCGWGYRPVMWSVVPLHWRQSARQTVREVVEQVHPGALIVLHESLPGPPVARLADEILPRLQDAGYEFVLVNDLWRTVRPGEDV